MSDRLLHDLAENGVCRLCLVAFPLHVLTSKLPEDECPVRLRQALDAAEAQRDAARRSAADTEAEAGAAVRDLVRIARQLNEMHREYHHQPCSCGDEVREWLADFDAKLLASGASREDAGRGEGG